MNAIRVHLLCGGATAGLYLCLLAAAACAAPGAGLPVPIKGTRVTLVPPPGFGESSRFTGYGQESTGASVMVTEIPGPFAECTRGFSDKVEMAKRGLLVKSRQDVTVDGQPGILLALVQMTDNGDFRKWMLAQGDEKATLLVTATCPTDRAKALEPALMKCLLSVRWDRSKPVVTTEGLPFSVTPAGGLKLIRRVGNGALYARTDTIPVPPDEPHVVVAPSIGSADLSDAATREVLARKHIASAAGMVDLTVETVSPVTINGLAGYEGIAHARDKQTGTAMLVYEAMLFDEEGYYVLRGQVAAAGRETHLPAFQAMARSIRKAPADASAADGPFTMTRETLSSEAKRALYLRLIEGFAGWIEETGLFQDDDTIEKGGGSFKAAGAGVTWARGNSNLCIAYALLLTELPQKQAFSQYGVPRARLQDHMRRAIRAVCLTNKNCSRCAGDGRWGGPSWQAALELKGAAWAAHLMEKQLDADTLALIKEVTCKEADNLDKEIASGLHGNTGSEDCSWNTPILALAACKYADDRRAAHWDELARRWAANAMSTAGDKESAELLDGRPVKEWMVSENLYPDLTLENHGFWSVPYQASSELLLDAALAYRAFGRPVPETLTYRARKMWNDVNGVLSLWDGDEIFPHGLDWGWKGYGSLEFTCRMATLLREPTAGAFESRGLQMLARRQQLIGTGELKNMDPGHQTVGPSRWAFCYLAHKAFGCAPPMPFAQAEEPFHGVHVYSYVKTAIHRTAQKLVSVSWHPRSQAIFVLPEGDSTFTDPPFFVAYDRNTGVTPVAVLPPQPPNPGGSGTPPRIGGQGGPGRQLSASSSINEERTPEMAADGDPETWWISGGREAGQGPTREKPQWLQVTFPEAGSYDRFVLCPRPGYGPRQCELLASADGESFRSLLSFEATQAPAQVFVFPQTTARAFRLCITSSYDPSHPTAARNVQVGEVAALRPGEKTPVWIATAPETTLIEARNDADGGMRVRYRVAHGPALQQLVAVVSLPDEATLYATAFRAADDIRVAIGPAFPVTVGAPAGFEKPVAQYRGRRWLNLADHLGFVSTGNLPENIPAGRFALTEKRTFEARPGEWLSPLAVVVYARQPHAQTERCAEGVRLLAFENGRMKVEVVSSSGKRVLDLDLASTQELQAPRGRE